MSYLIDGDVCSSCGNHIGSLWRETGCCPECGEKIRIPRAMPYICKISGKVCPYDDWDFMTGPSGRYLDNCPNGKYKSKGGERDSDGFLIVDDWCIYLKPNERYERLRKKINAEIQRKENAGERDHLCKPSGSYEISATQASGTGGRDYRSPIATGIPDIHGIP